MDPNINPKLGRVAVIEHGFHTRPILEQHVSSPSFQSGRDGARHGDRSRLEDEHGDEPREHETGFVQLALVQIAASAESKTGVGIGTPTARSAAQWAPAPIASTRMLGWGCATSASDSKPSACSAYQSRRSTSFRNANCAGARTPLRKRAWFSTDMRPGVVK